MTISPSAPAARLAKGTGRCGDVAERWHTYLAGVPVEVDLAAIGYRPSSAAFQPASVPIPAPASVRAAFAADPDRWLAAFVATLHRFSGQQRLLIGSPAGTGVLARRVSAPTGSFTSFAESVAAPDIPPLPPNEFAALVGRRRDAGRLFAVGYLADGDPQPWPEATISLLIPSAEDGSPALGYDASALDGAEVARLAAHLATLAADAVRRPGNRVSRLDLLPPDERGRILLSFNDTAVDYPDQRGFGERIADVATARPTAVALVMGASALTYAELDQQANQLAHHLRANGVGTGDTVGILLERSLGAAVATLGVMRAGAAVVPLDPADSDEWISYMIRDSSPRVVISEGGLADRLPARRRTVRVTAHEPALVRLDADHAELRQRPATDPGITIEPGMLSHVVYTSGSTGVPKGTRATHRSLTNLLNWLPGAYGITEESRGTWLCAPGFAISRMEWIPLLAAGAQVHVADTITAGSAERIRDWLLANEITHTLLVTTMAQRVCAIEWPAEVALRTMVALGEPMRRRPAETPFTVSVSYGSTEAAVVTIGPATDTKSTSERPSVGKPIANARVYVLDEFGGPLPIGSIGEIHVAGAGICAGYLNLTSETAERFVPSRLAEEPDTSLFRTGDLGRWRQDGSLEVLGRKDSVTWVNGFRVEVGEVENALTDQRGVREAAVVARRGKLLAYVVPAGHCELSADRVLADVRHLLPAHQSPHELVTLPALPRLSNGKLDRRQLPDPARSIALVTDKAGRFEPFAPNRTQAVRLATGEPGYGYWEWESDSLDPERFRAAWQQLVDRHDALRTVLRQDGRLQVEQEPPAAAVPLVDLRGLSERDANIAVNRTRDRMLANGDGTGRQWDVRLSLLPGNRTRVHVQLSQLVCDQISYHTVLVPELAAFCAERSSTLPGPGISYRDYALSLAAAESDAAGTTVPAAPRAGSRSAGPGNKAARVTHRISAQRWNVLKDRAATHGVSATVAVLTAFAGALHSVGAHRQTIIDVPSHRRTVLHPEIARVVGDFTATLPVVVESGSRFVPQALHAESQLSTATEATNSGQAATAAKIVLTSLLDLPLRTMHSPLGTPVFSAVHTAGSQLDLLAVELDGALHLVWSSPGDGWPQPIVAEAADALTATLDLLIDDADRWR